MIMNYLQDLHMCFSLKNVITGWQQLEVGIRNRMIHFTILFAAPFEVILIVGKIGGGWGPAASRPETPATKELYGRHLLPATSHPVHIRAAEEAGRAGHLGQDEVEATEVKEPLITKGGEK